MKFNVDDIQPVNKYTVQELLDGIADHFGSIRRFNLIAGRTEFDLYYLRKREFKNQNRMKEIKSRILADVKKLKDEALWLSDKDLMLIQHAIWNKYRTVSNFCRKNPEFTDSWISRLLHGEFKKITIKVKNLLNLLELEI